MNDTMHFLHSLKQRLSFCLMMFVISPAFFHQHMTPPPHPSPWISPPADRPIKEALRFQISPELTGREYGMRWQGLGSKCLYLKLLGYTVHLKFKITLPMEISHKLCFLRFFNHWYLSPGQNLRFTRKTREGGGGGLSLNILQQLNGFGSENF